MSSTPLLTTPVARTATIRHELTFLNVFRLVQALVYVGLAFSPEGLGWPTLGTPDFARTVTSVYLLFALILLLLNRRSMEYVNLAVSAALIVDIAAAVLAIAAMPIRLAIAPCSSPCAFSSTSCVIMALRAGMATPWRAPTTNRA